MNLVRDRNVWGVVLGRALTDPIWWFYVFWLSEYLSDARGFSLKRIALSRGCRSLPPIWAISPAALSPAIAFDEVSA